MIKQCTRPQDSTPIRSIPWDSSWPELAEKDERSRLLSYLEDRFGIPESRFDGYLLFRRKKGWWLLKDSPSLLSIQGMKVSLVGLRAFRRVGAFIKPSTRMIQVFGHHASKALFDVNMDRIKKLVKGEAITFESKLENGYVILTLKGKVLGLGLLINGRMRSQLPGKGLQFLIKF